MQFGPRLRVHGLVRRAGARRGPGERGRHWLPRGRGDGKRELHLASLHQRADLGDNAEPHSSGRDPEPGPGKSLGVQGVAKRGRPPCGGIQEHRYLVRVLLCASNDCERERLRSGLRSQLPEREGRLRTHADVQYVPEPGQYLGLNRRRRSVPVRTIAVPLSYRTCAWRGRAALRGPPFSGDMPK